MGYWRLVKIERDPGGTLNWTITVEKKVSRLENQAGAESSVEMFIGDGVKFRNVSTDIPAGRLGIWLGDLLSKHKQKTKKEKIPDGE